MVVECVVPPVVENVFGTTVYDVPLVVEYLHIAFSFVVIDSVVDVVPDVRVVVGEAFDSVGDVVSVWVVVVCVLPTLYISDISVGVSARL